jgi:hypothetical protein
VKTADLKRQVEELTERLCSIEWEWTRPEIRRAMKRAGFKKKRELETRIKFDWDGMPTGGYCDVLDDLRLCEASVALLLDWKWVHEDHETPVHLALRVVADPRSKRCSPRTERQATQAGQGF